MRKITGVELKIEDGVRKAVALVAGAAAIRRAQGCKPHHKGIRVIGDAAYRCERNRQPALLTNTRAWAT